MSIKAILDKRHVSCRLAETQPGWEQATCLGSERCDWNRPLSCDAITHFLSKARPVCCTCTAFNFIQDCCTETQVMQAVSSGTVPRPSPQQCHGSPA